MYINITPKEHIIKGAPMIVTVDGEILDIDKFESDGSIHHKVIKDAIGGGWLGAHVTVLPGRVFMYVDDDGIRKGLPYNQNASILYMGSKEAVYGNAVFVRQGDLCEDFPLTEEQQNYIKTLLQVWKDTEGKDLKVTIKDKGDGSEES